MHRGQSIASQERTALFEASYDTFAQWLNAPSRRNIVTYRNTTEAINAVMSSLLTDFRNGDKVVTTMMEHNCNYVPWHGLRRAILPSFGRRVECRIARFNHRTGELDLDHLDPWLARAFSRIGGLRAEPAEVPSAPDVQRRLGPHLAGPRYSPTGPTRADLEQALAAVPVR